MHDSGSFVVLESMANGLPVITINTGGPSVLTDESCAIRVDPSHVNNMVNEIADALRELYGNREKSAEMGQKAQERAFAFFDYDKKYEELMARIVEKLGVEK